MTLLDQVICLLLCFLNNNNINIVCIVLKCAMFSGVGILATKRRGIDIVYVPLQCKNGLKDG